MKIEKKILLVESEMLKPQGHFLDYLIETSIFFKNDRKILWFLNKNFNSNNLDLPDFCLIKKIIRSNIFHIKKNRILYFFEEIFFFITNIFNIFYFTFFFIKSINKLLVFYELLLNNYFIIPKYFKSFYLNYLKQNFNSNDDIIFQSCRRKDLALIYFLSNLEKKTLPKIHIRVFHLPNKRFKGFYFYIDLLKKEIKNKKIFIYTEKGFKFNYLRNDLKTDILINHTKPIFSFYSRASNPKKQVIGFVGEARVNKGFNKIPEIIEMMDKLDSNIEFIIHATDIGNNTKESLNKIFRLSKLNKNIKIINKYCNFSEYRSLLSQITIMPLLYDLDQINIGSGILYSCVSHEIIPIVPSNLNYLEDIMVQGSFLTANNLNDFCNKTSYIIKNYSDFIIKIKESSNKLKLSINEDPLIKNILN